MTNVSSFYIKQYLYDIFTININFNHLLMVKLMLFIFIIYIMYKKSVS